MHDPLNACGKIHIYIGFQFQTCTLTEYFKSITRLKRVSCHVMLKRVNCHVMLKRVNCHVMLNRVNCHVMLKRVNCHAMLKRVTCHCFVDVCPLEVSTNHSIYVRCFTFKLVSSFFIDL